MAFVKLLPPEGRASHSVEEVLRRLRDEFGVVHTDPEEGRDRVAKMIEMLRGFSDSWPGKWAQLASLRSGQSEAVCVRFGDDPDLVAFCCVQPGSSLFFDSPDEICGPARPLLERAASALGYTVYDG